MIETYGDRYRQIERNYEDRVHPLTVIMEAATLVEGLLHFVFNQFFHTIETHQERRDYLEIEKKAREKKPDLDKAMMGQMIGIYTNLCEQFSGHPWLDKTVISELNVLNEVRKKAAHPGKDKITDDDSATALTALEKILKKTGFHDRESTEIGFSIGAYLTFGTIRDAFESHSNENYRDIVITSGQLLEKILRSVLEKTYYRLSVKQKEQVLDILEKTPDGPEVQPILAAYDILFKKAGYYKLLKDGRTLGNMLSEILSQDEGAYKRLYARPYISALEIVFANLAGTDVEKYLKFAGMVRKFFTENRCINPQDQKELSGAAKLLEISKPVAERIRAETIGFLRESGIDVTVEIEEWSVEDASDEEEPSNGPIEITVEPAPIKPPIRAKWPYWVALFTIMAVGLVSGLYVFFPDIVPFPRRNAVRRITVSPSDLWTEPFTGMRFVRVPKGCYQMGCDAARDDCLPQETPRHEVCLEEFWIGQYEVTQKQWEAIMGENPSAFKDCGPDCPVEMVSWNDIEAFIKMMNEKTGNRFRLPIEAEWEYACRSGGSDEKYAGADDEDVQMAAWFDSGTTHPVGEKAPNGLGICDMSGNVREWCQDQYRDDAYKMHAPGKIEIKEGTGRVVRGGAWDYSKEKARCAFRSSRSEDRRTRNTGFRLVRIE